MGKQANDVVIVSGCRTAIAKFGGSLKGLRAHQLGALVMNEAVTRGGIEKAWELGSTPLVKVVAQTSAGVDPTIMGYGPVPAVEKLLAKSGHSLDEIGLFEVNEAFAAQYIACEKGLGLNRDKVNVNGSGVGLGHPVGCTGVRIVVSLIYEMRRRNEKFGIATLCVGGGMGMATLLELED